MSDERDSELAEAFGYRLDDGIVHPHSYRVAEGKDGDTLEPAVVLYVRLTENDDESQFGLRMGIETAEALAAELATLARRARENHWDPPGDDLT